MTSFLLKNQKVRDVYEPISGWMSCTVHIDKHDFEVFYTIINNITYFKPKQIYKIWEFEQLFGFTHSCGNYNENKIIKLI